MNCEDWSSSIERILHTLKWYEFSPIIFFFQSFIRIISFFRLVIHYFCCYCFLHHTPLSILTNDIAPLSYVQYFGYGYHGASFEQAYRCYPSSLINKVSNFLLVILVHSLFNVHHSKFHIVSSYSVLRYHYIIRKTQT